MSDSKFLSAIDIGSSKIVTLVGQYFPQEEKLNIIGVAISEAKGMRKGQIINIEQASESLIENVEAAERMAGFSLTKAAVGLAAPHITSLNSSGVVAVASPDREITPQDVERAIEAAKAISLPAASEILHVIPQQFIVDGQEGIVDPVGMTGVRLEVETHVVTVSAPALKNLIRCIQEVGVKPLALIYSGFAAAEAVLTETEKELGIALIDIGGGVTTLTAFHEGAPILTKVLPIGANNITNDLAIGLRLSLEEAERFKKFLSQKQNLSEEEISLKKLNISSSEKRVSPATAFNGIIKPRIEELFALVKQELEENEVLPSIPAGIVLTGGGALTVEITQIAERVLQLPVRIGQPEGIGGISEEISSPAFSSAVGLLKYQLKHKLETKEERFWPPFFQRGPTQVKGAIEKLIELIRPFLP